MIATNLTIRTKLFPPISNTDTLVRPTLLNSLENSLRTKLILVHAPAGYGKTTLLSQWFQTMVARDELACWLSLDELDENPTNFLRYFLASVREAVDDFWTDGDSWLDGRLKPDLTLTLSQIINDLSQMEQPLTVFIDDYQYIKSAALHKFIEHLVEWSPSHFRLVIGGRIIPPLPLSSWLVNELLYEVDVSMLRFSRDEVTSFLSLRHDLKLSAEQIEVIWTKSEGWAAGLQLVALVLRNHNNRDEFIGSFSGNLTEISGYLTSNVLEQQPADTQEFLLQTSILSRFNSELCDLLTGRNDSSALLQKLDSDGLFIVKVDTTESWYRFHHLFHDFLKAQLRDRYPHEVSGLYRTATDWFRREKFIREAVDYALMGNFLEVIEDIHQDAIAIMSLMGTSAQVYTWLSGISDSVKDRFPRLLILEGFALCLMNRVQDAETVNARINIALDNSRTLRNPMAAEDRKALKLEASLVPAAIAAMTEDNRRLIALTQELDNTAADSLMLATLRDLRGYALIQAGEFDPARKLLTDAAHYFTQNQQAYGMAVVYGFLGLADIYTLQFSNASHLFQIAEEAAEHEDSGNVFALGLARTMRAVIYYERNDLETAQKLLNISLPLIEEVGGPIFSCYGYIVLARCYGSLGEWDLAHNTLSQCLRRSKHCHGLLYPQWVERERLLITRRRIQAGADQTGLKPQVKAKPPQLPAFWDFGSYYAFTNQIRALLLNDAALEALPAMETALDYAEFYGVDAAILDALLLIAQVAFHCSKPALARDYMSRALKLAEPSGALRTFADEGSAVRQILEGLLTSDPEASNSYIERLLQIPTLRDMHDATEYPQLSPATSTADFVEALSQRELEVLQLVSVGKTNVEIGDQLYIAKATVKFHLSNIFTKLRATNRTLAVATARAAGLIQ